MATLRVTQGMLVDRVLRNINTQQRRIAQLQDQLATGLRVTRPSDSPLDARRAVSLKELMAQQEQFITNIASVQPIISETTSTVMTVVDYVQRAYELTVQGANALHSEDSRNAIAEEIDQILEAVLIESNHRTSDRYIFAGTQTLEPAFSAVRGAAGEILSVAYEGNEETIEVLIGAGITAPVNQPGSRVFQDQADLFQALINVRDHLRTGDGDALQQTDLAELERGRDQMLRAVARVGAVENRLERVRFDTEEFVVRLRELLSDSIDADFAEVIVNLNAQTNAFQAALNAGARVILPSLLDFVR